MQAADVADDRPFQPGHILRRLGRLLAHLLEGGLFKRTLGFKVDQPRDEARAPNGGYGKSLLVGVVLGRELDAHRRKHRVITMTHNSIELVDRIHLRIVMDQQSAVATQPAPQRFLLA